MARKNIMMPLNVARVATESMCNNVVEWLSEYPVKVVENMVNEKQRAEIREKK